MIYHDRMNNLLITLLDTNTLMNSEELVNDNIQINILSIIDAYTNITFAFFENHDDDPIVTEPFTIFQGEDTTDEELIRAIKIGISRIHQILESEVTMSFLTADSS